MHCTEYVVNMQKALRNLSLALIQHAVRKHQIEVTLLDLRQATQIQQISAQSDRRDVRHAENFCTVGVMSIWFFGNQQG